MDATERTPDHAPSGASARDVAFVALRGATRRGLARRPLQHEAPGTLGALLAALVLHAGALLGWGATPAVESAGMGREPPRPTSARVHTVSATARPEAHETLQVASRPRAELDPPRALPEPRVNEVREFLSERALSLPEIERVGPGCAPLAQLVHARPARHVSSRPPLDGDAPPPESAARRADALGTPTPATTPPDEPEVAPGDAPAPSDPSDASPLPGDGPPRLAAGNRPPDYPMLARRRGWEGRVSVGVSVDAGGRVLVTRLVRSSGYALLDEAALDAVATWRFLPARAGGLACGGETVVTVGFTLSGG